MVKKNDEYKLANAVLVYDFAEAGHLVRKIGASNVVSKSNYRDWPLFHGFRDSPEFLGAFEFVFEQSFAEYVQISNIEYLGKIENNEAEKNDPSEAIELPVSDAAETPENPRR